MWNNISEIYKIHQYFSLNQRLGVSPKMLFFIFASKSCKNLAKTRKREISPSFRVQKLPKSGQNIQHLYLMLTIWLNPSPPSLRDVIHGPLELLSHTTKFLNLLALFKFSMNKAIFVQIVLKHEKFFKISVFT